MTQGKAFIPVIAILLVAVIQSTEAQNCAALYQSCQNIPCCPDHMGIPVSCAGTAQDPRCFYTSNTDHTPAPPPPTRCFLRRCTTASECCENNPRCLLVPIFANRCV